MGSNNCKIISKILPWNWGKPKNNYMPFVMEKSKLRQAKNELFGKRYEREDLRKAIEAQKKLEWYDEKIKNKKRKMRAMDYNPPFAPKKKKRLNLIF